MNPEPWTLKPAPQTLHPCTPNLELQTLTPQVSDFGLCKTLKKARQDHVSYQMTGNTGTRRSNKTVKAYIRQSIRQSRHRYDSQGQIMAHLRQSRPESGLGFQVKALGTVYFVSTWLGRRRGRTMSPTR